MLGGAHIHLGGVDCSGLGVFVHIGIVVVESGLGHIAAMSGEFECDHIVGKFHKALLAVEMTGETAITLCVGKCAAQILKRSYAVLQREVVAETRSDHIGVGQYGVGGLYRTADFSATHQKVHILGAVAHHCRAVGARGLGSACLVKHSCYSGQLFGMYRVDCKRAACGFSFGHLLLLGLLLKLLLLRLHVFVVDVHEPENHQAHQQQSIQSVFIHSLSINS